MPSSLSGLVATVVSVAAGGLPAEVVDAALVVGLPESDTEVDDAPFDPCSAVVSMVAPESVGSTL